MATKIKGSNVTSSTFIIPGDLQVDGTTTTINSTTLTVDDKNLVLASGAGNAAAADGAGLTIDGASATFTYAATGDKFGLNKTLEVTGDLTVISTDAGSAEGPLLILNRDSGSPANGDVLGRIKFMGDNDAGENVFYAGINAKINDNTNGTEDGFLDLNVMANGTPAASRIRIQGNGDTLISNRDVRLNIGVDLIFEGSTSDNYETTLTVTDPTADRTITLPDATGTVITTANSDTPSTTTSSSDADHVLVDDGGVLKKITPSNLGIGGGGGSAADDISAGDAAVNITTTTGNITLDAQETNTDIIFKGTTDRYPGITSAADQVFLTLDGQEYGALKLGPNTPIIFPSSNSGRLYLGGTGSGTQVFKSGTVTYFTALSGDIRINTAFNHRHVECKDGDRTMIFYDDNEKLRTTSTGVYVTGGVRVGGNNAANELDDYEEGTFTPDIRIGGSASGISHSSQTGAYTKIGRKVTLTGRAALSSKGSNSGAVTIGGMPFASQNTSNLEYIGSVQFDNLSGDTTDNLTTLTNNNIICRVSPNVLTVEIRRTLIGANDLTNVQMSNTAVIVFTITYFT